MLGFTKEEQGIILFLIGSLLVGSTVKLYQHFSGEQQIKLKTETSPAFMEEFRKRAEEINTEDQFDAAEADPQSSANTIQRSNSAGANHVDLKESSERKKQPSLAKEEAARNFLININTANAEELQSIPRVGPVLAQKIIDYRNSIGRFNSVEELTEVSGIGKATLEKIRPYISIN